MFSTGQNEWHLLVLYQESQRYPVELECRMEVCVYLCDNDTRTIIWNRVQCDADQTMPPWELTLFLYQKSVILP